MRDRNDSPKDSHEIIEVDSNSTDSVDFMNNAEVIQNDASNLEQIAYSLPKEFDSLNSTSDLTTLDIPTNYDCDYNKSNSNRSSQDTVEESNIPVDGFHNDTKEAVSSISSSPTATYQETDNVVDDKQVEDKFITKPLTPPSRAEDHVFKQPASLPVELNDQVFKRPKTPPRKTIDYVFKRPKTPPRKADNNGFKRPITPPRQVHNRVIKKPPPRVIYNRIHPLMVTPYGPPCGNPDSNPYGNPYAPVQEESFDLQLFEDEFSIVSPSTEYSIKEPSNLDSLPKSENYRRYSPFPDQMLDMEDSVNNEQCTNNNNQSVNTHDNDVTNIGVTSHTSSNTNYNDIPKDNNNIERIQYTSSSITNTNEISNDESTIEAVPPTSSITNNDEVVKDVPNVETTSNQSSIINDNEILSTKNDTKMLNTSYTSLTEGIMIYDVDTPNTSPTAGSKETVNMNTESTSYTSPLSNEELFNESQTIQSGDEQQVYVTNTETAINGITAIDEAVLGTSEAVVERASESIDQSMNDEKTETPITVSKDEMKESEVVIVGVPDNDDKVEAAAHTDVSSSREVTDDNQSIEEVVSSQKQAMSVKKKGRGRPRKVALAKKDNVKAQPQDVASTTIDSPVEDLPPRSRKAPKRYREEVDEATSITPSDTPEVSGTSEQVKRKYRRKGKESSVHANPTIEEVVPVPARRTRGRKRKTTPVQEVVDPVESIPLNEAISADEQTQQDQQVIYNDSESPISAELHSENPVNRASYFDVALNADNSEPSTPTARSKRQTTNASDYSDATSNADVNEAPKATARPRRKTANIVNYADADNGESSSTTRPKRRSAVAINYSDDIPANNGESSKPTTRTKRKLNVVNYSDDASLDIDNIVSADIEHETPTPKRSKVKKGKSAVRPSKAEAKSVAEEVNETEIADTSSTPTKKRLDRGKAPMQQVDRNTLDFLLTNKESFLTNEEFKEQVVEWISKLNKAEKQELAKHLPDVDLAVHGNTLKWDESCAFLSHPYLWQGVEQWQEILSYGGFEEEEDVVEGRKEEDKEEKEEEKKEDGGFKDDNFESYWGERLGFK